MKEHLLDEFEEEQEEYEIDKLEEIRRQYSGLLPLFYNGKNISDKEK